MSNQVSILCSEKKKEEEKNSKCCRVYACPLRKIWEPSALNLWNSSSKEYTRAHQVLLGHSTAKFTIFWPLIISLGLCRCIEKQSDGITKTKFVKLWHRLAYLGRRPLKISLLMQIGWGEISTIMFWWLHINPFTTGLHRKH